MSKLNKSIGLHKIKYKGSVNMEMKISQEIIKEAETLIDSMISNLSFADNIPEDEVKDIVKEVVNYILQNNEIINRLYEIKSIDKYTFKHSINVCVLSIITGIYLDYGIYELIDLGIGAILHDIGKTKIPNSILNKPGKLTDDEYEMIKKHSSYGYEILKYNIGLDEKISRVALHHHEKVNGRGYPYGKRENEIDTYSKIVAITDVYDALTSNRIYRKKMKTFHAVDYIISMAGYQFNKRLVQTFAKNIPIYSKSKGVMLSNGHKGIVIDVREEFPTKPVVKVLYDRDCKLKNPYNIDLLESKVITVVDTLDDI
ncbi:HD-GYP domain-containing protein [Thermohalobacter berrensis]|nr:HD-GYP domain-containing protein [Thermohalobacter berrensis]